MYDIYDNHFKVIKLNHPDYKYLVISSTPCDATKYITSADLPKLENGVIAFDLLLHSGMKSRRFATMKMRDGILDRGSLRYYPYLDSMIERESIKFFAMHTNLITQFYLTDNEKSSMFHAIKDYFCATYA